MERNLLTYLPVETIDAAEQVTTFHKLKQPSDI